MSPLSAENEVDCKKCGVTFYEPTLPEVCKDFDEIVRDGVHQNMCLNCGHGGECHV